MVRIPVYSLAALALGFFILVVTHNEPLAFLIAGVGSLIGYFVWLRGRLRMFRGGKSFHVGSVANTIVCTFVAVGLGLALLGVSNGALLVFIVLAITAAAIWLEWKTARDRGTTRWLPTASEVGHEIVGTMFAEEPAVAGLKALAEVSVDVVKNASHMGRHSKADGQ